MLFQNRRHNQNFHGHDDGRDMYEHEHRQWGRWHDHGRPEPLLRATPLDEIEIQELEKKRQEEAQKELSAKKLWQLKASKWTEDDLQALMFNIHEGSRYAYLNGKNPEIVKQVELEAQAGILDKKYGNPQELQADLTLLEEVETRDDIVIIKGEKLEKKEKLPPQILDALYAMTLSNHILAQNFLLTVDENRQPIVTDNANPSTPERQEQAQELQKSLRQKTSGDSPIIREWQGDNIKKPDWSNSRIIPKINTYITTAAFLAMNMDMGAHDDASQREFASVGTKDLPNFRNELVGRLQGKVDEKSIKESDLTAWQKSFLLAWKNESDDGIFSGIRDRQTAGFLDILSNPYYKTAEQKTAENSTNMISKNYGKIAFWAIGIAAFIGGLSMLLGPNSKFWQRIVGGFMLLTVWAFGAKTLDGLVGKTGLYAQTNKTANGTPVDGTGPLNESSEINIVWSVKDKWRRFINRRGSSEQGVEILMKPELEPITKKYPAWAMLYALYEGSPTEQNKYANYKSDDAESTAIHATLDTLSTPEEKQILLNLIETSWERNMEIHPELNENKKKKKKLKLPEIITSLDTADSWMNYLPDWIWGTEKKIAALKIIAPKAKEWGGISLKRLQKYFIEGETGPDNDVLLSELIHGDEEYAAVKSYVESFDMENQELTLQQYLKTAK